MGKRIYVLDTSALLAYPDLMFRLEGDCEIVIPRAAVRELDGLKRSKHLMIVNAAETVLNTLHFYGGQLNTGAELLTGATLRTCTEYEPLDDLASEADNEIVGAAIRLHGETGGEVIVLSTDINMRNVARVYGLTAKLPYFEGNMAA
ncbi:MAG: PIN domain-containing protein [Nitrospiraceae bacterium]|nr:PIN domain-containing protein [Nitrospiraceae bacterium]